MYTYDCRFKHTGIAILLLFDSSYPQFKTIYGNIRLVRSISQSGYRPPAAGTGRLVTRIIVAGQVKWPPRKFVRTDTSSQKIYLQSFMIAEHKRKVATRIGLWTLCQSTEATLSSHSSCASPPRWLAALCGSSACGSEVGKSKLPMSTNTRTEG